MSDKMRDSFEQWAMSRALDLRMDKDAWGQDRYYHSHIDAMWTAWQAAQSVPVVGEVVAWKADNGQWAATAKDAAIYERRMCKVMKPLVVKPPTSIPATELDALRNIVAEVAGGILHDMPLRVCSCAQCELIRKAKTAIAKERQP